MLSLLVPAALSLLVMVVAALRADRSLPPAPRLPMQFGLGGNPTWSAPRAAALAAIPAIAAVVFGITVAAAATAGPEAGEAAWVNLLIALLFPATQQLHFWLIRRWFAKGRAY